MTMVEVDARPCVGSYFPILHRAALEMLKAQNGISGWAADSVNLLDVLDVKE